MTSYGGEDIVYVGTWLALAGGLLWALFNIKNNNKTKEVIK